MIRFREESICQTLAWMSLDYSDLVRNFSALQGIHEERIEFPVQSSWLFFPSFSRCPLCQSTDKGRCSANFPFRLLPLAPVTVCPLVPPCLLSSLLSWVSPNLGFSEVSSCTGCWALSLCFAFLL